MMDRLLLLEAEQRRARADALMLALKQQGQQNPSSIGDPNTASVLLDNSSSLLQPGASNAALSILPSSSLLLAQQQQPPPPQASIASYLNATGTPIGNTAQITHNTLLGPPLTSSTPVESASIRQLLLQQQQQESLASQAAHLSQLSQGVQLFHPQGISVAAAPAFVTQPNVSGLVLSALESTADTPSAPTAQASSGVFKSSPEDALKRPPATALEASPSPSSNRPTKREHFPEKLLRLLLDADRDPKLWQVLHFSKDGNVVEIHDPAGFERDIIPRYFRHGRLCSFKRQLNLYGFQRLHAKKKKPLAFSHPDFSRNQPESCLLMDRVNVSKTPSSNDDDNKSDSSSTKKSKDDNKKKD